MFGLTKEQLEIKKSARKFAVGEFTDVAREMDEKGYFDDSLWKKAAELGFLAVFIEEKYDGMGMGYFDQCLIQEEFARVDMGITHAIEACFFGSQVIAMFGTEAQKQKYLPSICNGSMRMGVAVTEPDAGSDVAGLSTEAIKDGDDYIINGGKVFITNCKCADFLIVLCITDPGNPSVYKRFSTILVETDREGYEGVPYHGKLSIRTSETGDATFRNVRVPQENLIGQEGMGFYNIMELFNRSRVQVAALGVGTAQGALDKALAHVKQREQFGKPLASLQMVQGKLAEMVTKTEAARSLYYRAAMQLDTGKADPGLSSMAKWYCSEVAVQVADEAIQLHGGYGILEEYGVAHYWRNAKVLEIFEGSKEVEKVVIAKKLIGKF